MGYNIRVNPFLKVSIRKMVLTVIIITPVALMSCQNSSTKNQNIEDISDNDSNIDTLEQQIINHDQNTVIGRIKPPDGYTRTEVPKNSFQHYLRTLKLKPVGSLVEYYDGTTKPNHNVYHSVVDLDIGNKDLHQCADAVMRLRAEYLWEQKQYEKIHFNFTNGFRVNYSEWMKGRRVVVNGNETYWNNRSNPLNTYDDFWKYLELIFSYAGTASLEKEMVSIDIEQAEIGDVLIQGGYPGHAVIIVDKAENSLGNPIYLLAQSYMPAQEIQILLNPLNRDLDPWYELKEGRIITPEWNFTSYNLKRFNN